MPGGGAPRKQEHPTPLGDANCPEFGRGVAVPHIGVVRFHAWAQLTNCKTRWKATLDRAFLCLTHCWVEDAPKWLPFDLVPFVLKLGPPYRGASELRGLRPKQGGGRDTGPRCGGHTEMDPAGAPGRTILYPENRSTEAMELHPDEMQIQGVLVGQMRSYR